MLRSESDIVDYPDSGPVESGAGWVILRIATCSELSILRVLMLILHDGLFGPFKGWDHKQDLRTTRRDDSTLA